MTYYHMAVRHRARLRYATLFACMLLFVGCGGGTDTGENADAENASAASEDTSGKIDACALITQDDATALFGMPAVRDQGTPVVDPNMMGECLWTWDSESSNQLLQIRIWNGTQYYSAPDDSQPVDFAETGYIRTHPIGGVDIDWTQDGKTVSVSYSTIGPDVPKAETRAEEVKQVAQKLQAAL